MNFCFDFLQELLMVWEAISNIRKGVSSDIQTPWSWLKKNSAAPRFLNHFSVFGYRMKHSSSCLIYYVTSIFNYCTICKTFIQYQDNIKQTIDENKSTYKVRNHYLIQYQILQTNFIRIVWQTVRIISKT